MVQFQLSYLVAVGLGGAIGAMARFALGVFAASFLGEQWPWGTFFANMIGAFFIGLFSVLLLHHFPTSPQHKLFVITGVLGGFTTFSAVTLELIHFLETGRSGQAAIYAAASLGVGLLCVLAGLLLGRSLTGA